MGWPSDHDPPLLQGMQAVVVNGPHVAGGVSGAFELDAHHRTVDLFPELGAEVLLVEVDVPLFATPFTTPSLLGYRS